MPRPIKNGLDYYPKDVDFYEDEKIIDLLMEYGPVGVVVYEIILSRIYRQGYYLECPVEKLIPLVLRSIGNRWAGKKLIAQVIRYCGEIGLFDAALLKQNVITSTGIQRRYDDIKTRNNVDKSKYRLINENGQPLIKTSKKGVIAAETPVIAAETGVIAAETTQKKRKEKGKVKDDIDELNNISESSESILPDGVVCQPEAHKKETQEAQNRRSIQSVIDAFNEICTDLPKVKELTETRKKAIKSANDRITKFGGWEKFFEEVHKSDFLNGRNDRQWKGCGFDWLLKPSNLVKIIEGNYKNREEDGNDRFERSYDLDAFEAEAQEELDYETIKRRLEG